MYSAREVKIIVEVRGVGKVHWRKCISAPLSRGSGRINWLDEKRVSYSSVCDRGEGKGIPSGIDKQTFQV